MLIKTIIEEARAVISTVRDLHAFGMRVREARAARFIGKWTNEGDCTGPLPSHFVEMELSANGTEVSGVVKSRALETETFIGVASFAGRRRGYRVAGEVTSVSRRRLIRYGKVRLHLRKGLLEFRGKNLVADFLPAKALLWRQPAWSGRTVGNAT